MEDNIIINKSQLETTFKLFQHLLSTIHKEKRQFWEREVEKYYLEVFGIIKKP
jgi:hypothetical protein